jgi:hypothetical protein
MKQIDLFFYSEDEVICYSETSADGALYPRIQDSSLLVFLVDIARRKAGVCDGRWSVSRTAQHRFYHSVGARFDFRPGNRLYFFFFSFLDWGETESTCYVGHSLAYCTSPG